MRVTVRVRCACGCDEKVTPGRTFRMGHDRKLLAKLEKKAGGLLNLVKIVERHFIQSHFNW